MYRHVLCTSGMMLMSIASLPAMAQNVANYKFGMLPSPRADNPVIHYSGGPPSVSIHQFNPVARDQVQRWANVGRCVATSDRQGSLSYIAAERGSPALVDAAQRLDPAFASCFSHSGVYGRSNVAIRRAALADALKVRLPRG